MGRPLDDIVDQAAAPLPGILPAVGSGAVAQGDFVTAFLAGQGQQQQDATLSAARRDLPAHARSWGVAEVGSFLHSVGLDDVATAFETEQVNGELLLDLSREGGLGHAYTEAINPDRLAKLADGALTMGRELALRRAVESLGDGAHAGYTQRTVAATAAPLPRRGSESSEASVGTGVQSLVTRAAWRFIAASPTASARQRAGVSAARPARPRKGNLSDAQVKGRKRSAGGFAATFIGIEAVIVLTGSDSAWIHLVSMLPGMLMTLAGVTAFFQT